jgi:hypothetical protein
MSEIDTRPKWMLRKQARISSRRLSRFGTKPGKLDAATWWQQINEAAADLALDAGPWSDWHAWPVAAAPVDDSEPL